MHTKRTILLIVAALAAGLVTVTALLVALLGPAAGLGLVLGVGAIVALRHDVVLRPWYTLWGTTPAEARAELPGDDLVADAAQSTRAVSVAAPPEEVWPWLVQIGFDRAGWYSYDWIDNDGHPSADTIVPAWQDLAVGDRILMVPDVGFVVRRLDPPRSLVALADDGSVSWCLHVTPDGDGSRLVSRFRTHRQHTAASALAAVLMDPGTFVMERKMLKGIARRAARRHERLAAAG